MSKTYITITGCEHYFGQEFMKKGMLVTLEKEPDNKHDKEAIKVTMEGLGKVGYVANSVYTVLGESQSAGRIYDKMDSYAMAKIMYVLPTGVVCKVKFPEPIL
ncbi:MAG: HIRAN domain-containing protein [Lachnospiraceae bacterium]|nr:HIRAN domain-containing protein [Lachnospiraceae bacterium]